MVSKVAFLGFLVAETLVIEASGVAEAGEDVELM